MTIENLDKILQCFCDLILDRQSVNLEKKKLVPVLSGKILFRRKK